MEELSVSSSSNFINDCWLEIKEDGSWDVLSSSSLREESVEGIITSTDGFIRWHLTIRLNTVFKTEELPAGVTNLNTGLSNMDIDDFSHFEEREVFKKVKKSEKPGLVNDVFSGVAKKYDVMNDIMSIGIHRLWKDFMLDWIAPKSGQTLLDVAGGTGDVAMRFIDRCKGNANAIIADFTEEMIFFGKNRSQDYQYRSQLDWLCADAMNLPVSDEMCDIYTISFGLRNVSDLEVSLAEAYRVLRKGGRIMILEFSTC